VPPRSWASPGRHRKLMASFAKIGDFDLIELNEAFASQGSPACVSWASPTMPSTSIPRRRHRARPSARHVGRAARHDGDAWASAARRQARARHHVRGGGAGSFARARARELIDTLSHNEVTAPWTPTGFASIPTRRSRASRRRPARSTPIVMCSVRRANSLRAGAQIHAVRRAQGKAARAAGPSRLDKNVIVQASCHGKDNAALIDAMESSSGRARGIAVIGEEISDAALQIHGPSRRARVRFNFVKRLVDFTPRDMLERIAARVAPLNWHIVVYFEMPDLPELESFSRRCPPRGGRPYGDPQCQKGRRRSGEPALPAHAGEPPEHLEQGDLPGADDRRGRPL